VSAERRTVRITRSLILFVAGLAGLAYEALAVSEPRPTLLVMYAGMLGLPAFIELDSTRRKNGAEK
jgi:hypothetical protein